jgi:transposase
LPKLSWHAIVNYLLLFLYMGCQWKMLPIRIGADGKPEIHYSRLHRALSFLEGKGVFDAIFTGTVKALHRGIALQTATKVVDSIIDALI